MNVNNVFVRTFIIRIAFLLSVLQLSIAVYLNFQFLSMSEFYNRMFIYSLIISLIPVGLAILLMSFTNFTNVYEGQTNDSDGFISKTNSEKHRSYQINDITLYLLAIGLVFLSFNLLFRFYSLPNWTNLFLPIALSMSIIFSKEKRKFSEIE